MENSFCFKLFALLGVHPDHEMNTVLVTFINFLTACCFVLALIKCYLNNDLESLETSNGLIIMTVQYLALVFGRKTVKQILNSMSHFWAVDVIDDKITFYIEHFKRVDKIYKVVLIFGYLIQSVKPFIFKGSSVFSCYVPLQIPLPLFCAVEYFYLIFVVSAYVCLNIFVCFLIISLVVQFRLINLKIKDLGNVEVETDQDLHRYKRNLKFIIEHQQFLMRCVEDLNALLSIPVALLMGTSVMMMCISMYVVTIQQGSISDKDRPVINSFALIAEFFLVYGLPAQLLMDETELTAEMIYAHCKWHLPNLRPLREDFLLMISRSQRSVCIRAGSYHVVNNRTVLIMLKTAYSLYTFLQQVA